MTGEDITTADLNLLMKIHMEMRLLRALAEERGLTDEETARAEAMDREWQEIQVRTL